MKKIIGLSISLLTIVLSCQKDDNITDVIIENNSVEIKDNSLNKKSSKSTTSTAKKGDIGKTGISSGTATTHDDFSFEYADGYDSSDSTSDFVYKLLKIQFYKGTTAQEKWELKEEYAQDLYGWEIFYVEDCVINENIQFWSIRIDRNLFNSIPPIGPGSNGEEKDPTGPLNDDEEIICEVETISIEEKDCEDIRDENS